jgi:ABC-type branched-subunit amino acid transport system substrate-binding protein
MRRPLRRTVAGVLLVVAATAGCGAGQSVDFRSRAVSGVEPAAAGPGTTASASAAPKVGGLLPAAKSAAGRHATSTGTGATADGGTATGGNESGGSGETSGVITVGTVLPLEGGDRDWGVPVLRTTQAYIDELNARGGVDGYKLRLIAYNACLTCQDDALTAVRHLVEQDHVFAIVNTYVMVVAFQSVIPYLEQHGVPLIQGASEAQDNDALAPINFVTAPPGQFYVHFLTAMVAKYSHLNKVAITYMDVPTESHGLPLIERALRRAGVEVVDTAPVAAEEQAATNMDALVTRFRSKGAQGVSFPTRDTPQMHQFLDVMHRRYPGGSITGHTLAAWVGMQLLVQILGEVGRPDRAAFLDTLNHTTNLDLGTTSPLTFSPARHMGGSETTLLRLHNGEYVAASRPVSG